MKLMVEIEKLTKKYLKSEDFKQLCDVVRHFCDTHKEKIRSVVCQINAGTITFFFIAMETGYDFKLADAITDLSIQLARDLPDEYTDFRQMDGPGIWFDPNRYTHVWGEEMKKEEEETNDGSA